MLHFRAWLDGRESLIAQFAKTATFFPSGSSEPGWYIAHLKNYRLSTGQLEALQESLHSELEEFKKDQSAWDSAVETFLAGLNKEEVLAEGQEAPPEALSGTDNEKEEK